MKKLSLIFVVLLSAVPAVAQYPARRLQSTPFAQLGTPADSEVRYCPDCQATSPCTGGGTGAVAQRVAGFWNCSTGAPVCSGCSTDRIPKWQAAATQATAAATITLYAASAGQTVTVGGKTYTFSASSNAGNNILIDEAGGADMRSRLAAKINADTATTLCTAVNNTGNETVDLAANTPGSASNSIALSTDVDDGGTDGFSGGADASPARLVDSGYTPLTLPWAGGSVANPSTFSSQVNFSNNIVVTGGLNVSGTAAFQNMQLAAGRLFTVSGGIRFDPNGILWLADSGSTKPSCTVSIRGYVWVDFAASGIKDALEICLKAADNIYAWRVIY